MIRSWWCRWCLLGRSSSRGLLILWKTKQLLEEEHHWRNLSLIWSDLVLVVTMVGVVGVVHVGEHLTYVRIQSLPMLIVSTISSSVVSVGASGLRVTHLER